MKEEEEGDPLSVFRLEKCEFENWALEQEKEEEEEERITASFFSPSLLPPTPILPSPGVTHFLGRGRRPKKKEPSILGRLLAKEEEKKCYMYVLFMQNEMRKEEEEETPMQISRFGMRLRKKMRLNGEKK